MADKETKYDLAAACAAENRYAEAIALYRELIAENPDEDSLKVSLAWTYRDCGRMQEAVALFEELLKKELARKVFTGFAYDELVRIHTHMNNFPKLIEVCRKAVEAQPDDVGLLFTLGETYMKSGMGKEAAAVFEKLTGMEPESPVYFYSLGNALIAVGDHDRAEAAYDRAVSLDPDGSADYFYRMGNAYFQAQIYDRARSCFIDAVRHRGDRPFYYCSLGDAYLKQGKIEEAKTAYDKAVEIDPEHGPAYFNRLGNMLAGEGLHSEAVGAFKKAVSGDAGNPFLHLHLARSYLALGMVEEAEEACRRATTPEAES